MKYTMTKTEKPNPRAMLRSVEVLDRKQDPGSTATVEGQRVSTTNNQPSPYYFTTFVHTIILCSKYELLQQYTKQRSKLGGAGHGFRTIRQGCVSSTSRLCSNIRCMASCGSSGVSKDIVLLVHLEIKSLASLLRVKHLLEYLSPDVTTPAKIGYLPSPYFQNHCSSTTSFFLPLISKDVSW